MKEFAIRTAISLFFIAVALLLAEGVLASMGYSSFRASLDPEENILESHPDQRAFCQVSSIEEAVNQGLMEGPLGGLKEDDYLGYRMRGTAHGFSDPKAFDSSFAAFRRVLVLGDSFTLGASADKGKGYVDLLNHHYRGDSIFFFNSGVGGYSQNNQLAVLQKYFDIIQPQLVLLGFYSGNDFLDNLTPKDRYTVFPKLGLNNYEVVFGNNSFTVRRRSEEELIRLYQLSIGCEPDALASKRTLGEWFRDEMFYSSRLGTQIYLALAAIKRSISPDNYQDHQFEEGKTVVYEHTRQLLSEMKTFLKAKKVDLWVLLIPDNLESNSTLKASSYYLQAVELMKNLNLPYIDPFHQLTLGDYAEWRQGFPDEHWNNQGHYKGYREIVEKLDKILVSLPKTSPR